MGYALSRTPSYPVLWNPEIVESSLPRFPYSQYDKNRQTLDRYFIDLRAQRTHKGPLHPGPLHPLPEGLVPSIARFAAALCADPPILCLSSSRVIFESKGKQILPSITLNFSELAIRSMIIPPTTRMPLWRFPDSLVGIVQL